MSSPDTNRGIGAAGSAMVSTARAPGGRVAAAVPSNTPCKITGWEEEEKRAVYSRAEKHGVKSKRSAANFRRGVQLMEGHGGRTHAS